MMFYIQFFLKKTFRDIVIYAKKAFYFDIVVLPSFTFWYCRFLPSFTFDIVVLPSFTLLSFCQAFFLKARDAVEIMFLCIRNNRITWMPRSSHIFSYTSVRLKRKGFKVIHGLEEKRVEFANVELPLYSNANFNSSLKFI